MRIRIALAFCLTAALSASASFQASFDKDFTAESADGPVLGRYSADVLWENLATYLQPGVVGTAALIGTGKAKDEDYHVVWENKSFLNPDRGSVSFWVCPLDWDGTSTNFHVFFRADGSDAEFLLYYFPDHTFKFILGPSRKVDGRDLSSCLSVSARDWRKEEWHQVAAVWDGNEMLLYLDGAVRGRTTFVRPKSTFRRFGAGGVRPLDWKTPQDHSLIDELRIEHEPLAADVLREEYLKNRPSTQKSTNALLEMTAEDVAEMKKPELWRNNDVGKEIVGEVPYPWTSVSWEKGSTFVCWNRAYDFADALLPRQILSAGETLFSRPALVKMNGKGIRFGTPVPGVRTAERIELSSVSSAGGYDIRAATRAEFDGFVWIELEFKPQSNKSTFDSLQLEFPFRKETSTLFNAMVKNYGDYKPGDCGAFKDYRRNLFLDWTRTMFVGNERVGLEWFCEEMSDWNLTDLDSSLRLIKGEKENLLVLTLADCAAKPGKTYRYRFGFQAQPVKPLERNWRRVRNVDSSALKDVHATSPNFVLWFPWESVHNVPEARYAFPDVKTRHEKASRRTDTVLWYFAGFSVSPFTPVWKKHGLEWTQSPPAVGTIGQPDNRQWGFARACPQADGYIDYYVWNLERTVRKLGMEGLYFDNQDPQFCDNDLHGHGWVGQDGKRYRTYNLLATRELVKRIWRMYKRVRPNGRIMRHMTQKSVSPITGFADWLCDGECYCGTVGRDESYVKVFDPAMFRAQFMTAPYGIPRYLCAEFQRSIKLYGKGEQYYHDCWEKPEDLAKHQDVIRHFIGYIIVHDALITPHFGVFGNEWYEVQDRFGFDGSERCILYTDPESPFAYDGGRVMASVYCKPDGKVLVAVMNDSDAPLTTLRLDPVKLVRLTGGKADFVNAETREKVVVREGVFRVTVPARDYVLIGNFK